MHAGVIFVIAGTGPLESQLREEAAFLGIAEHIRFLGYVTDRVGLYHALDALMMTSDFEGTPMTLLEAMASGLPVVASAVDGIAEVCTHGKQALLAPSGDLGRFQDFLRCIIDGKVLRQNLGDEGRRSVLESYDIRGIARRIERVYEEVLEFQY